MLLSGPTFFAGNSADSLVVMLHGRGASGDNMMTLATGMSKKVPSAKFIAPHAPKAYGTGYTWFSDSIRNMDEKTAFIEIIEHAEIVSKFIDAQLEELHISDDKLSLVGFSQGAMLAIYIALSRAKKCAAVVAYSGAIPFPHLLKTRMVSKPDICVMHGRSDEVIPFSYFEESVAFLKENGVPVVGHAMHGLDHRINSEGLEMGSQFIKERLRN